MPLPHSPVELGGANRRPHHWRPEQAAAAALFQPVHHHHPSSRAQIQRVTPVLEQLLLVQRGHRVARKEIRRVSQCLLLLLLRREGNHLLLMLQRRAGQGNGIGSELVKVFHCGLLGPIQSKREREIWGRGVWDRGVKRWLR